MHVEFGSKVRKDLKKLPANVREAIRKALDIKDFPPNADIKALKGIEPWQRLRVGPYRIIFKELTAQQLKKIGTKAQSGIVVARILNRKDLEKEIRSLR